MPTKIEWAEETWNPVTGCTTLSEGCAHCYAQRMAKRLAGRNGYPADSPFQVTLHPDRLEMPLHWRKPRRVFVCSMGDLFHEDVPDEYIDQVWRTMQAASDHTFMVLTKRPRRMWQWVTDQNDYGAWGALPLANVWLGVTAENQAATERIVYLLRTPAIRRFVSCEPLLGPVTLRPAHVTAYDLRVPVPRKVDLVIVGGETGPHARVMAPEWARALRDECQDAGISFFFKKWGDWKPDVIREAGIMRRSGWQPLPVRHGGRLLDGREWNEIPGQG